MCRLDGVTTLLQGLTAGSHGLELPHRAPARKAMGVIGGRAVGVDPPNMPFSTSGSPLTVTSNKAGLPM